MGGSGTGEGDIAPEDPDAKTKFKSARSPSALRAGRMLLRWSQKGEAPPGEVTEAYRVLMREVKQGVSEAILRERVPPGYQRAIQRYFDSLERRGAPPAERSGKAGDPKAGEGGKRKQ